MAGTRATRIRQLLCLACGALLAGPAAAEAAWNQPVGGLSPINFADDKAAISPNLTTIGGVPYVAWTETDVGDSSQVRVSRMNAAGTDWEEVVGGPQPINRAARDTDDPTLAAIGGVPYVAWTEFDTSDNYQVRVSRLNGAGTAWEEVVGGASPINHTTNSHGFDPSLTTIGGVPYVAWTENDGAGGEIRVSRLNATGADWEEPWTGVSATSGGINHSTLRNARGPSLAVIGGVLHVTWIEDDTSNYEVRVSRLVGNAWQQIEGGTSPINQSTTRNATRPRLADVGGVPHVAWSETDGTNTEIRVSRLNGANWQQVVGGTSPINQADDEDAIGPDLTAVGGVPYVAWDETDGTNTEIRVSRLDGNGSEWEQVVGGASPVNQAANRTAAEASLTGIGGVPYVARRESDGTNHEIRVSRIEPELTAPAALATGGSAVLLTQVRSFGVPYPVAFEYGPGGALGSRSEVTTSAGGELAADTVFRFVDGLAPATDHSYRAVGFDGTRAIAPGATAQFTTAAPTASQGPPAATGAGGPAATETVVTRLLVAVINPKLKGRSGKRVTVNYLSTAVGTSTLEVLKGRKRVARVTSKAKVGRNKIAWNGKQGRKKATRGRYTLRLTATGGDGQVATDTGTVTLKR
jgi:hypothetical protein